MRIESLRCSLEWKLAISLAGALLAAPQARGFQEPAQPAPEHRSRSEQEPTGELARRIHKGSSQLAIYLAAGNTLSPQYSVGYRPTLELAGHWGRIVSKPRGPGFLRGNLEVGIEVAPLFLVFRGDRAYGAHVAIGFRHFLSPSSRVRPFIALSSGPLLSSVPVPEDTSRFNFASSIGLGLLVPATERLFYTVEAGLQHISNADTSPHNPGMSSVQVQIGIGFFP